MNDEQYDLKSICKVKNILFPKYEMESLDKKQNRIALIKLEIDNLVPNYIRENQVEVGEKSSIVKTDNVTMLIEKYAFLVDSAIHTACSMLDCMLHIINITLLGNVIKERDVDIRSVKKVLKEYRQEKVLSCLEMLLVLKEYRYLHDYDILTKHRGIIDANFSIHVKKDERVHIGGKIQAFIFGNNKYQEMWVDDIWEYYKAYYMCIYNLYKGICDSISNK